MKRLMGISALVATLVLVCGSHNAWSLPKRPLAKVLICHVDQETGVGTVLSIAEPAVSAHCRNHAGDYTAATDAMMMSVTLVQGQTCPTTGITITACPAK